MSVRVWALPIACVAALGFAGCGSDTTETPAAVTTSTVTTSTVAPAPETGAKVSANSGSADEIAAALTAAGVQNAERWTREVMEYRPYDTADPSLASLRQELLKYNPAPDQLEKILGALTP